MNYRLIASDPLFKVVYISVVDGLVWHVKTARVPNVNRSIMLGDTTHIITYIVWNPKKATNMVPKELADNIDFSADCLIFVQ